MATQVLTEFSRLRLQKARSALRFGKGDLNVNPVREAGCVISAAFGRD
jgi:hypothetical protein